MPCNSESNWLPPSYQSNKSHHYIDSQQNKHIDLYLSTTRHLCWETCPPKKEPFQKDFSSSNFQSLILQWITHKFSDLASFEQQRRWALFFIPRLSLGGVFPKRPGVTSEDLKKLPALKISGIHPRTWTNVLYILKKEISSSNHRFPGDMFFFCMVQKSGKLTSWGG